VRPGVPAAGVTLAATFTWKPDYANSPTPTQVTVIQRCTASWTMGANSSGFSGQCNSGLSPGHGPTSGMYEDAVSGIGPAVVSNPGQGFTISACMPTASVSGITGNTNYQCSNGTVSFAYTAAAVTMSVAGTTPDANGIDNILVGQGATGNWNIPASLSPYTTYKWAVSGTTFQSWTVNRDTNNNPISTTYADGPGVLTNSTAHWYWDDVATTTTVTCTATVTPPAGQGSPFSIMVTQPVSLLVPVTTEAATVGRVQINSLATAIYGSGPSLYAGGNGTASQPYGIIYTTQVNTPAPFSAGIWNMVQLVTPGTWYTPLGQPETASSGNGVQGLDTRYPFYPSSNPTYPTGVPANNQIAQPYDGPGIRSLRDTVIRYRVSDNFSTYVMFLPPGGDAQWVPLWIVGWNWNADDSIPGATWANWNNATDAGIVRVGNSASTTTFPMWNNIVH